MDEKSTVRVAQLSLDQLGLLFSSTPIFPLGYNKANDCMVQLGNGRGFNQHIDHCVLRHPRQWSCLQVFEGGENVRVTNNHIGMLGPQWATRRPDPVSGLSGPAGYDGAAEEGGHWADGVSYAAQNGLVAGNHIIDTTDGGIGNYIYASARCNDS